MVDTSTGGKIMLTLMLTAPVGVLLIILGVICMKGNVSLVHWYHKRRVTEENQKKFAMLVGMGILIIGLSVIVNNIFLIINEIIPYKNFSFASTLTLSLGIVIGLMICFYAMIKYNRGIF